MTRVKLPFTVPPICIILVTACQTITSVSKQQPHNQADVISIPLETPQLAVSPSSVSITTNTPSSTPSPTNTFTPMPTNRPSITPTGTNTPTSAPVPSASAIPEQLLAEIRPAFGAVLFVQVVAELVNETAVLRDSGELGGFETFGTLLAAASIIDQLEEARVGSDYFDLLEPSVKDAYDVLQDIRSIMARWFNNEINSAVVKEEMPPVLKKTDEIANEVDDILAGELGLDRDEMTNYRDEIKAEIQSVLDEFMSE